MIIGVSVRYIAKTNDTISLLAQYLLLCITVPVRCRYKKSSR